MATYTHTMQLTTGGTLTFTLALTDENAQRIIASYRAILGAPQNATSAAIWTRIAQGVFDGIKANTIAQETEVERAAVTVPPIEAT